MHGAGFFRAWPHFEGRERLQNLEMSASLPATADFRALICFLKLLSMVWGLNDGKKGVGVYYTVIPITGF